jgi:hypothetical protein
MVIERLRFYRSSKNLSRIPRSRVVLGAPVKAKLNLGRFISPSHQQMPRVPRWLPAAKESAAFDLIRRGSGQ